MSSTGRKVAVIGGGVAGLMAAVTAAHEGASVSLFEKMPKVGLKMGITGKGRCNLTNSAPIMDFIAKTRGMANSFTVPMKNSITKTCFPCFIHGALPPRWKGEAAYFQRVMMPRKCAIYL